MTVEYRFELMQAPKSPAEAQQLSAQISQTLGVAGWELVSVVTVGTGKTLLLSFQQSS